MLSFLLGAAVGIVLSFGMHWLDYRPHPSWNCPTTIIFVVVGGVIAVAI